MINARGMTKNEIANSVRKLIREARKNDVIPSAWKITVSSGWSALTPRITLKVRNHDIKGDYDKRYRYEGILRDVANFLNYDDSFPEYDHFDVGYYLDVFWM